MIKFLNITPLIISGLRYFGKNECRCFFFL